MSSKIYEGFRVPENRLQDLCKGFEAVCIPHLKEMWERILSSMDTKSLDPMYHESPFKGEEGQLNESWIRSGKVQKLTKELQKAHTSHERIAIDFDCGLYLWNGGDGYWYGWAYGEYWTRKGWVEELDNGDNKFALDFVVDYHYQNSSDPPEWAQDWDEAANDYGPGGKKYQARYDKWDSMVGKSPLLTFAVIDFGPRGWMDAQRKLEDKDES